MITKGDISWNIRKGRRSSSGVHLIYVRMVCDLFEKRFLRRRRSRRRSWWRRCRRRGSRIISNFIIYKYPSFESKILLKMPIYIICIVLSSRMKIIRIMNTLLISILSKYNLLFGIFNTFNKNISLNTNSVG